MKSDPSGLLADITGAALVAGAILIYDPAGWFGFVPAKWATMTALAPLLIAAVCWHRRPRIDRSLAIVGLAFLAWLAFAAAVGLEGRYAWLGTPERHAGVLMWLVCAGLFVCAPRLRALGFGAVIAAVGLLFAIGQQRGSRLSGTFGSAAYLGAACALLLPLTIGLAMSVPVHKRWRIAATVGSFGLIAMLVGSGTRGAWIGISLAAALAVWRGWRPRAVWIGLGVIVAVASFVFTDSANRVTQAFDSTQAGGAGRVDEWRVGLRTLAHHPLTGVGPEGYRLAFREGVDASYERAHGREVQPERAHNVLLDTALTTGIPGLFLYLGLLFSVGRLVWRKAVASDSTLIRGAAIGLAAYQLQQLFLFPLSELEPIAWMIAGSIVAMPTPQRKPGMVPRALVAVGAGAIAIFAGFWGFRDIQADRAAWQAVQAHDRGDAAGTRRHLADALAARDDEVRLQLLAVNASFDNDVVTAALARAQQLSPLDPIVIRDVADNALRTSKPTEALRVLRHLVDDDPNNAYLQQKLGTAAAIANDFKTAEQAWTIAEDLAPKNPSPPAFLASLYEHQGRNSEARDAARRALLRHPDQTLAENLQAILIKVGG